MSENENQKENENVKIELVKAEAKDAKYSNPMLGLLLALGYLGVFGSLICIFMIIMSAASGSGEGNLGFLAAALTALLICIAAVVVMTIFDKRARKKFLKNKKRLRKNAKKIDGKIIGVQKNIRHVRYMSDVFDEIIWNFLIEYKNENNETVVVKSDGFLNDISEVLRSSSVTVYDIGNGTLEFGGYKLRKSLEEDFVKLDVEVKEEDSKV